jgi:hypothetical protein
MTVGYCGNEVKTKIQVEIVCYEADTLLFYT